MSPRPMGSPDRPGPIRAPYTAAMHPSEPMRAGYDLTTPQKLYLWLTAFFVACLIIADIVGPKLFRVPLPFSVPLPWSDSPLDAIEHTCGMLTFPVTFLLTDLINEYYGKRAARRVTFIALVMALFVFVIINIAQSMPHLDKPYNVRKEHFDSIFGSAKIMYIASLCAYLVGQLLDIWFFHVIKRITRGRLLWLRATGSTIVSQMIDSVIVVYLAFGLGRQLFPSPDVPPAPMNEILAIAATGYILKFVLAVAITPLIYAGHGVMRRWFGLVPLPPEARA